MVNEDDIETGFFSTIEYNLDTLILIIAGTEMIFKKVKGKLKQK